MLWSGMARTLFLSACRVDERRGCGRLLDADAFFFAVALLGAAAVKTGGVLHLTCSAPPGFSTFLVLA